MAHLHAPVSIGQRLQPLAAGNRGLSCLISPVGPCFADGVLLAAVDVESRRRRPGSLDMAAALPQDERLFEQRVALHVRPFGAECGLDGVPRPGPSPARRHLRPRAGGPTPFATRSPTTRRRALRTGRRRRKSRCLVELAHRNEHVGQLAGDGGRKPALTHLGQCGVAFTQRLLGPCRVSGREFHASRWPAPTTPTCTSAGHCSRRALVGERERDVRR